jgi:hypothetical protein
MRDDLTYRQQRTLNLISESLLTGKTELAEQALNEQFPGLGGRRGPKLTMTMPDGSVADMNPSDVNDIAGAGGAGGAGGDDAGGGFLDILNDIASIPKDLTADLIGAIDDLFGDNLTEKEQETTAVVTLIVLSLLLGGGGGGGGSVLPGGGGGNPPF